MMIIFIVLLIYDGIITYFHISGWKLSPLPHSLFITGSLIITTVVRHVSLWFDDSVAACKYSLFIMPPLLIITFLRQYASHFRWVDIMLRSSHFGHIIFDLRAYFNTHINIAKPLLWYFAIIAVFASRVMATISLPPRQRVTVTMPPYCHATTPPLFAAAIPATASHYFASFKIRLDYW